MEVDLRTHWTGVRDQGARSSCLACATSDAHSFAQEVPHPLSAEYLFFHSAQQMPAGDVSNGLTFEAADTALRGHGQPHEVEWPYQALQPQPWTAPDVTELWRGGYGISLKVPEIINALRSGCAAILGLRMVRGFYQVSAPHYIIDPEGVPVGGHAVLAVGLGRLPGSKSPDLLLVRNSWGFRWGFGGHAWLPAQYLHDKLIDSRVVTASINPH